MSHVARADRRRGSRHVRRQVAERKGVAWCVYNAHTVGVETSGSIDSFGGSGAVNLISESSGPSATAPCVIPPLVLFGTGAMPAIRFGAADIGEAVASARR